MQKQELLSEVLSKLSHLGINCQKGERTDILIQCKFVDARWSTGKKKISYESYIFFNEDNQIVYMYEKTTESGYGFSFGMERGSFFQSDTTLFRKVKNIQYSEDGKVYEYNLDLGVIPKTVKEAAKHYGWRFKTVLNKSSAMYPCSN